MDGGKTVQPAFSKAWRRRITDNLPRRLTPAYREALTTHIEESIRRWFEIKPEIAPHRAKLKRLAAAADKLQMALNVVKDKAETLRTDAAGLPMNTADGHMYLIASRAEADLARWNRLWRPKKARPKEFSVSLTHRLQDEYRLFCGSLRGFKRLLVVINAERRKHYPTLPELTVAALEKRKQRKH